MLADGGGDAALELGLGALAEVAEDCIDADYNGRLPAKRRADVLKALNASAPAVVAAVFGLAGRAARGPGPAGERRLVAALRCLRHFATWVSWDGPHMAAARAAGDPVDFAATLAARPPAGDGSATVAALQCLRALAASPHLDLDASLGVAAAVPRVAAALFAAGAQRVAAGADAAALWAALCRCAGDCFKELCARFKALGALGGDVAADGRRDAVDGALAAYHGALLGLLEASASRRGPELLLPAFREAAKLAQARKVGARTRAAVHAAAPRCFDAYVRVACRCAAADGGGGGGGDDAEAYDAEFVDADEYAQHFANMRAGLAQLVAALAELDAAALARAAGARLARLLAACDARDAAGAAAAGPDAPGWALLGYGFVVERVVDECGRYGDGAARDAVGACVLAPALAWRPPRDTCERAYAKLLLVDATRGALPRAGGGAVVAALEHVFAHLRFRAPAADPKTRKVRRKAAMTLNRLAEVAPHALALQFDALRDGAARVIASRALCDVGAQHVCEALVLASNAVRGDAEKRRSLLEAVVASPLADLASPAVAAAVATPRDLLAALGVLVAAPGGGAPAVVGDAAARAAADADGPFCSPACDALRRALGLLLGVARRAHAPPPPVEPCGAPAAPAGGLAALAAGDAAAAVLARCLGAAVAASRAVHGLWAPPLGAALRGDGVARLALAPAVDEIRAKTDPGGAALAASGGGLGTAAGLLRGRADSDHALRRADGPGLGPRAPDRGSVAARWACMLNELRSALYQMARLWVECRGAFAADGAELTAGLFGSLGLLGDAASAAVLESMEHRHVTSLLKHVLEPLMLRCPPALYDSHLAPVLRRLAAHVEARLAAAWSDDGSAFAAFCRAGGLAMADFDDGAAAAMAEAATRDLGRQFVDALHVGLALRGELAQPVARALERADRAAAAPRPPESDGARGARVMAARDARAAHAGALAACLLPPGRGGDDGVAPLLRAVARGVRSWADVPTCRGAVKVAEAAACRVHGDASYWPALALLFDEALGALVGEPAWLANAGCEYDLLSLCRAVYVALVLAADPARLGRPPPAPPRHDGPRRALLALPGVGAAPVARLEDDLRAVAAHKDQKNAFHELVVLALNAKPRADDGGGGPPGPAPPPPAGRRVDASSLRGATPAVLDLPGDMAGARKLVPAADGGGLGAPNLADLFKD